MGEAARIVGTWYHKFARWEDDEVVLLDAQFTIYEEGKKFWFYQCWACDNDSDVESDDGDVEAHINWHGELIRHGDTYHVKTSPKGVCKLSPRGHVMMFGLSNILEDPSKVDMKVIATRKE